MRLAAFCIMVLVSACVNRVDPAQRADSLDNACRLQSRAFAVYERCVTTNIAADPVLNSGPHTDLVNQYLAGVRLLEDAVSSGKISDPDAFMRSAAFYSELKTEYFNRIAKAKAANAPYAANNQRRSEALMGLGLGLMQMGQPRPLGGPTTTCHQIGNMVQCY